MIVVESLIESGWRTSFDTYQGIKCRNTLQSKRVSVGTILLHIILLLHGYIQQHLTVIGGQVQLILYILYNL